MNKILCALVIILVLPASVLCIEMPSDVPPEHYAHEAIFDLVERDINVSQGYPDGTFHGNKYTNRYEIAYLMASLAISLRENAPAGMDLSDIKEEIEYLKKEIKELEKMPSMKRDTIYYGSVELNSKFGSVIAYDPQDRNPLGPEANYRLKYTIERSLGKDSNLKVNLDTMDGGFNSPTQRTFPLRLLDIEGDLVLDLGLANPVRVKASAGPGTVYHRDTSGVAPSEDYTAFSRPKNSVIISTNMAEFDVSGAYVARSLQLNGTVGINELYFQLGKKIGSIPVIGKAETISTTRYIFTDWRNPPSEDNDLRQELSLLLEQDEAVSEKLMLGVSTTDKQNSNLYLNFELYLRGLYSSGTDLKFILHSVGEGYRLPVEALEFVPVNLFDKKILDGTVDIALEITHPISNVLAFKGKSDWVGDSQWKMGKDVPGSSFTQEFSLKYTISRDLILNTFYRYYYVPSRVTQYAVDVPEVSDLVGLGLTYNF